MPSPPEEEKKENEGKKHEYKEENERFNESACKIQGENLGSEEEVNDNSKGMAGTYMRPRMISFHLLSMVGRVCPTGTAR